MIDDVAAYILYEHLTASG